MYIILAPYECKSSACAGTVAIYPVLSLRRRVDFAQTALLRFVVDFLNTDNTSLSTTNCVYNSHMLVCHGYVVYRASI